MSTNPPGRDGRRLRLLVAIALPASWQDYLAASAQKLERLAPGYTRWVAPELLHLTLIFLGEQAADRLAAIQAAVAEATEGQDSFSLSLGRLGHFGGGTPRVLWAEARAPRHRLEALHGALRAALSARQIGFDNKPLVPHLTLGRARRDAATALGRTLAQRLATLTLPPPPEAFAVGVVTLYQSDLSPRGPRYTALAEYPLATREPHGRD